MMCSCVGTFNTQKLNKCDVNHSHQQLDRWKSSCCLRSSLISGIHDDKTTVGAAQLLAARRGSKKLRSENKYKDQQDISTSRPSLQNLLVRQSIFSGPKNSNIPLSKGKLQGLRAPHAFTAHHPPCRLGAPACAAAFTAGHRPCPACAAASTAGHGPAAAHATPPRNLTSVARLGAGSARSRPGCRGTPSSTPGCWHRWSSARHRVGADASRTPGHIHHLLHSLGLLAFLGDACQDHFAEVVVQNQLVVHRGELLHHLDDSVRGPGMKRWRHQPQRPEGTECNAVRKKKRQL